ncbi:hypothetical protein [Arcobacter sp. F2176]|uniref:hypothetical protein n=1 Tax=Arcobacter sp. F2176 TaxID=2044511 RepID=UPI0013E95950|nr:hypothetical protein [Arcobacter sp. F2176]
MINEFKNQITNLKQITKKLTPDELKEIKSELILEINQSTDLTEKEKIEIQNFLLSV